MFSPTLMEKVAKAHQYDLLHEAETARLLKDINGDTISKQTKLAMVLGGMVLITLIVVQML